jgi:hypothetical protein
MNIIECKINEEKLCDLADKAYELKFVNPQMIMNTETLDCLNDNFSSTTMYTNSDKDYKAFYDGIPIVADDKMKFGEAKIIGFEKQPCTRITIYADGSRKIETTTDNVVRCIE